MPPATSGVAGSSSYRERAALGTPRPQGSRREALEKSNQDLVISGRGEVSQLGLETWGMGAAGDGGSHLGTQGESPTSCLWWEGIPLPRADLRLRPRRLALCWQQGLEITRLAAWMDGGGVCFFFSSRSPIPFPGC